MHRSFRMIVSLTLFALVFAATGFAAPAFAAKKQVIKFASLAPEGTTWMRVMRALDKDMRNTTDKAVALLGVRDLVVVETPDALLVCAKDRAQEVRQVVGELARRRQRANLT